jgi:hypothetical protein
MISNYDFTWGAPRQQRAMPVWPNGRQPHGRNIRGHQRSGNSAGARAEANARNIQSDGLGLPVVMPVGAGRTRVGSGSWMTNQRPAQGSNPAMRMPTQTVPNLAAPNYKGVLPGLSAEEDLFLNQLATNSAEDLLRARNRQREELGNLNIWADQADNAAQRSGYQAGTALRANLSDSGLGFSPMFVGRGMRDINNQVAAARNQITGQRGAREAALARMLQDAEFSNERTLANINSQRAMLRSQPGRGLLGGF